MQCHGKESLWYEVWSVACMDLMIKVSLYWKYTVFRWKWLWNVAKSEEFKQKERKECFTHYFFREHFITFWVRPSNECVYAHTCAHVCVCVCVFWWLRKKADQYKNAKLYFSKYMFSKCILCDCMHLIGFDYRLLYVCTDAHGCMPDLCISVEDILPEFGIPWN
jgi:hypothetical protein